LNVYETGRDIRQTLRGAPGFGLVILAAWSESKIRFLGKVVAIHLFAAAL